MTPEVLSSNVEIQALQVSEVVNYLIQNHWSAVEHPNPRRLVFEKGIDDQGKPIQIVLPSRDDYEDTAYLLAKAVNLLSVLDSVPFSALLRAISDASVHAS